MSKLQVHQQSLPRLPVPPLQATLEKYLLSVRPLLTEEEYRNTENVRFFHLQKYKYYKNTENFFKKKC